MRTEYLQNRKNGSTTDGENDEQTKAQTSEEVDVVQKAKDLFGESTVNIIDEE